MQNMIPMNKNGKQVNAFFDINWGNKRVENISLIDDGQVIHLSASALTVITGIIEQEITAILAEFALDEAEGKVGYA